MKALEFFPAAAKWDLNKLTQEINKLRKEMDNKRKLSEKKICYLCGVLAEYSPKEIGRKFNPNITGRTVSVALCDEINPYVKNLINCSETVEGQNFWGTARRELEQAGYKKNNSPPDSQDSSVIKIKIDYDNPSMADLEAIAAKIRKATRDESIEIQDIRRGCIELVLSGSSEGLKRLESLINSGELQEVAGVRIISAESAVEPSRIVRLYNWLDDVVDAGWQVVDQILNPRQLQTLRSRVVHRSNAIPKGKLIDRSMLDDGFAVFLTLNQETLADGSVEITVQIYPTDEHTYLPSGIKLRMFSSDEDGNEVSAEMQANSEDEWVELHFAGESGEEFAVEIIKGNISVSENFVI